jgi:hypothetical protein
MVMSMTIEADQKNSIGWQLQQNLQNLSEWIALQLNKLRWNVSPNPRNTKPNFSGL